MPFEIHDELDPSLRALALGPGIAYAGGSVTFVCVVQERIAISSVFASPADAVSRVEIAIIKHEPDKANVRRFDDGSTISDQGISSKTYELEGDQTSPPGRRSGSYQVPSQIGNLRASTLQRVTVTMYSCRDVNVELRGALLYQRVVPSAIRTAT